MRRFLPLVLALTLLFSTKTAPAAAMSSSTLTASVYDYTLDAPGPTRPLVVVNLRLNDSAISGDMPAVLVDGRTLAPLRLLAEALGVTVEWLPDRAAQVRLTKGDTVIDLTLGAPTAAVDGQSVSMPDGVPAAIVTYEGQGYTMVPLRFFSETLGCRVGWDQGSFTAFIFSEDYIEPLLAGLETPIDPNRYLIAIDAGHGGSATGAVYGGVEEKALTLSMTRKLRDILTALGYNTVMTRDEDVYMGLYDRAYLANDLNADLFVSIHCNAAENTPDFQGLYVYHYPESVSGAALAQSIQTTATAFTGAVDRGIDHANFVVLRESYMPAVLVETGFMTCQAELERLVNTDYQTRMVQGVAQGIIRFLDQR